MVSKTAALVGVGCKIFLFHPSEFATIVKYDDGDYYSSFKLAELHISGWVGHCYHIILSLVGQMEGPDFSAKENLSEKLLTSLLSIFPRDFGVDDKFVQHITY